MVQYTEKRVQLMRIIGTLLVFVLTFSLCKAQTESKEALYDAFKSWRDGGQACSGQFNPKGEWKPENYEHDFVT